MPYTLYWCVLNCCMEDVQHQLQSYLPSIKSSISELSDFSENVSDLSDFSPHVSIANTIHISVAPDFITHDSFSPPWDNFQFISASRLHLHNHIHLTMVTQLPNNSSSHPQPTRSRPTYTYNLLISKLFTTHCIHFYLPVQSCAMQNYSLLLS